MDQRVRPALAQVRSDSPVDIEFRSTGFFPGEKRPRVLWVGIKGSPTNEVVLENCRIPGDRIIGEPGTGFKTALATLDHTRPTIGAQAVGIAQGALDAAIAYTKDRKQFGESISTFQAIQFMLADMAMKVEAARLMVYSAAARAEPPGMAAPRRQPMGKRRSVGVHEPVRKARHTSGSRSPATHGRGKLTHPLQSSLRLKRTQLCVTETRVRTSAMPTTLASCRPST